MGEVVRSGSRVADRDPSRDRLVVDPDRDPESGEPTSCRGPVSHRPMCR